jgi:signal transduction histidine kinase/DNA-binding response OmpR family regulator
MQTPEPPPRPSGHGSDLTELVPEERTRILSSRRLTLNLSLMVLVLVGVLLGLIWILIGHVFARLEPSVREDLIWKAERGVAELSHSTDLGILMRDRSLIAQSCQRYVDDRDVLSLWVTDAQRRILYSHGDGALITSALLGEPAGSARVKDGYFAAWSPVQIEGALVGNVALSISTRRLQAGAELRTRILAVSVIGLTVALLAALAFVNLRIVPVLRLTEAAFAELEKKTRAALESSRLKGEFLANVSHEIRTPLNGIIGIVGLMLKMPLTGSLRRYVHVLDASSRSLLSIVSDVLDFSKIEAGKLEVEKNSGDPSAIACEVSELYAQRAHEKGLELICSVHSGVPATCIIDAGKVRQVISNLVGNAIKFTKSGEVLIEVAWVAEGSSPPRLEFEVSDTGIGIAPEDRTRLFQAFSQVDGSSVRNHGGTGLGLVISKRLVEAMSGEIGFDSAPGVGTRFWFRLPAEPETWPKEYLTIAGSRRALVVDGNDTNRRLIREQLARWGIRAEAEPSGVVGLDRLQLRARHREPFDAVLVAERTSDISAREFVEQMQRSALTTPVLQLRQRGLNASAGESGAGEPGAGELAPGVAAVVDKPIRPSELYAALRSMFEPDRLALAEPAVDPAPPSSTRQKRVLIVDDNDINRFVAAELVSSCGFVPAFACNGQEAVDAVSSSDFALVLMDCQMPIMDGYTAAKRIREREGNRRHTRIVALTAHALAGEREHCASVGMDGFLTKPIRAEALQELLAGWLASEPPAEAGTPAPPRGEPPAR